MFAICVKVLCSNVRYFILKSMIECSVFAVFGRLLPGLFMTIIIANGDETAKPPVL